MSHGGRATVSDGVGQAGRGRRTASYVELAVFRTVGLYIRRE